MATKCYPILRGRRIRLTRLDGCGRPVYGPDSVVVSKGFVSVALTANIDEGEAITVTNAGGENCINEPAVPRLSGYGVAITFCNVEPDALSITTGQKQYNNYAGDAVGFSVDTSISLADTAFALEMWLGAPSDNCAVGATGSYGYVLLPFVQGGVLGDFTVENAAINLAISNAATKTGGAWGAGPFNVMLNGSSVASPLPRALTSTEPFLLAQTTVAPPTEYCGAKPLLDPAGAALTSITATPSAGKNVSVSPTPTGAGVPWYVEFGDGTWQYVANGGAATHTYATMGTYTVTGYRGTTSKTASVTTIA